MEFLGITKKEPGKFINRYNLTYRTKDNKEKIYEIISRDRDIKDFSDLHDKPDDAVVLIMHNKEGDKLLLNKEFRLSVGEWVYNFPAGLIEPGEAPTEAAKRELKEETGLDLIEITDTLPTSYGAVGFSNEKNLTIIGVASGEFADSSSTVEEIEAGWYGKEELRDLLKTARFAARTQTYCYLFANME